jgi:hypothetical protein
MSKSVLTPCSVCNESSWYSIAVIVVCFTLVGESEASVWAYYMRRL